ncbi:NAD(+) diphosphatase [Paenibacillus camerounensis]|uniref:NAD(+) diphosphatase n=1 Tax=Paenibacillus camerounensis TaxID=1243663 RepID=UPI0005A74CFA|nr:NAD(+) diphosphatase [Paenibacillus camerounensis]
MSKPEASIYTRYLPSVTPDPQYTGSAYWLITHSGKLLILESSEQTALPLLPSLDSLDAAPARTLYLGSFAGMPCFAAEVPADTPEPAGMAFRPLRNLYDVLDEDAFHLAGRALQLLAWDETHQFCGKCGTATVLSGTEHARSCPACGQLFYPRLAPAVITAILKDGRILLAHAPHFPDNMYGLIAGFVEPGETLEDCVAREIREEVGITVKNITYFGSQQWPFPNSLMVGFLAEYESGEISVDGIELDHAAWFSPDSLPNIPPRVSIARKIIDWYVEQHS